MKKFVFTIALCAGLAVSAFGGFTKAVTFTATGYQGSATLENFPVLVKLPGAIEGFDYSDFGTETNLVFRDAGGNPLPHEIDTWDTSGTSLIWVRLPSLTATTSFTMFFCGSEAVANDSASTWTGANYVGVWHMDEADGHVAAICSCFAKSARRESSVAPSLIRRLSCNSLSSSASFVHEKWFAGFFRCMGRSFFANDTV